MPGTEVGRRALLAAQLDASRRGVVALHEVLDQLERWGVELRARLEGGARLLVAGNGGSAALAQHLTAELVGRYDRDRPAYSALALSAETSSLTALGNDYGYEHVFARQIEAHGRPGDVLLGLTTSGRSPNLLAAVAAARRRGVRSWAMTGPVPNPLAAVADDTVAVPCPSTAAVQDVQQVAVHLLCRAFELAAPTAADDVDDAGSGGLAGPRDRDDARGPAGGVPTATRAAGSDLAAGYAGGRAPGERDEAGWR